ncbi:unnamed protein product [Closterium sp. NIES-54]
MTDSGSSCAFSEHFEPRGLSAFSGALSASCNRTADGSGYCSDGVHHHSAKHTARIIGTGTTKTASTTSLRWQKQQQFRRGYAESIDCSSSSSSSTQSQFSGEDAAAECAASWEERASSDEGRAVRALTGHVTAANPSSRRQGESFDPPSSSPPMLSPNIFDEEASPASLPPGSSLRPASPTSPTPAIPPPSPPRFSPPFLAPRSPSLFPPRQQPPASHSRSQSPVPYPGHTRFSLVSCSSTPAALPPSQRSQPSQRSRFSQPSQRNCPALQELHPESSQHELRPFWSLPCVRAAVALQPTRSKGHVVLCEARAVSPGYHHHCYHENCQRHSRNKEAEAVRTISPVSMRCMRSSGRFMLVQSPQRGMCQPLPLAVDSTGSRRASGLGSQSSRFA